MITYSLNSTSDGFPLVENCHIKHSAPLKPFNDCRARNPRHRWVTAVIGRSSKRQ